MYFCPLNSETMSNYKNIEESILAYKNTLSEPFSFECIFFDMDGILFDSMPFHARSWIEAFAEFGLIIPEHEPYMNEGSTALYTIEKMFEKYKGIKVSEKLANDIKKRKHEIMTSMPPSETLQPMPRFVERVKKQGLERWVVT